MSMSDGEEGEDEEPKLDPKLAAAKKVAPMIASKKVAGNINKWNTAQAENHPATGASGSAAMAAKVAAAVAKVQVQVRTRFWSRGRALDLRLVQQPAVPKPAPVAATTSAAPC